MKSEQVAAFGEAKTADLLCSPKEVESFLARLGGEVPPFHGEERRRHPRQIVAIPTEVQPLDDDLRPLGRQVHAVAHNLSAGGLGLLYRSVITTRFIAAHLRNPDGAELRLLAKVLRCERLGRQYDIGCRIVTV